MTATREAVDPTATVEIQNVVATSAIEQEVNLESVVMDLRGSEYDPGEFPGLIYRLDGSDATVLLFRSGNLTATGAASRKAARAAIGRFLDDLRALGLDVPAEPTVDVQNIVATADLSQSLNLSAIAIGLGLEHTEYEPEQFPGLVYRLDDPDVVVLLFGSGKCVITGGNHREVIERALDAVTTSLLDLDLIE